MLFETYLHGFQWLVPFGEGNTLQNRRNVCFGCCIIGVTALFLYQVYLNVTAYLAFEVATAVSYQHLAYGAKTTAIDFPAITICSNNIFLADQVGFGANVIPAFVLSLSEPLSSIDLVDAVKMCTASNGSQIRPDMAAFGLGDWMSFVGVAYTLQEIMQNSFQSVIGCRWQGKPLNCADLFLNRMTDDGGCFTFYPSGEFIDSFKLLNASLKAATEEPWFVNLTAACALQTYFPLNGRSSDITPECAAYVPLSVERQTTSAFGTTRAQIAKYNLTTSAAGPRSGLQLIMNVQPNQYCVGNYENSLGFFAAVHDRSAPPILQIVPNIDIPAGFVTNIAISITQIVRDTEFIGKCKSAHYLEWYPTIPKYNYDACVTQFVTTTLVATCQCVPFWAPPYMISSGYVENFGLCEPYGQTSSQCYNDFMNGRNYSAYDIPKGCTNLGDFVDASGCPTMCRETQYTTASSFAPLSSPAAFKTTLDANVNVAVPLNNLTEFRKSFAIANFYYEQVEIMLVYETQAFTIMNVMNGIGGSLGLCLGGSFITAIEVIVAIVRCCERGIAPTIRRKGKRTHRILPSSDTVGLTCTATSVQETVLV